MKVKTIIKLERNKPLSLNDHNDLFESFECGNKVFTMRRYMPINGHDDSLPYQADLYLNGKGFCHCFNDGWGGETQLTPMGRTTQQRIHDVNQELKENFKWEYRGNIFKLTLDFVADSIACCKESLRY